VSVHPKPLCVTGIGVPSIVSVALRSEKLFSPVKIVMVAGPVPVALAVIVSHGALEVAVQEHWDGRTIFRFRIPPLEPNDTDGKLMTGCWHDPAA
jgi:hypothetical protein